MSNGISVCARTRIREAAIDLLITFALSFQRAAFQVQVDRLVEQTRNRRVLLGGETFHFEMNMFGNADLNADIRGFRLPLCGSHPASIRCTIVQFNNVLGLAVWGEEDGHVE